MAPRCGCGKFRAAARGQVSGARVPLHLGFVLISLIDAI
jgi:hypothetical protein